VDGLAGQKRESFNPMSLLRNPMALMMIMSIFMVVLFSNIDPETLKEVSAQAAQEQAKAKAAVSSKSQ
jgi:uncharacterized membrane protein (DUF106 family)